MQQSIVILRFAFLGFLSFTLTTPNVLSDTLRDRVNQQVNEQAALAQQESLENKALPKDTNQVTLGDKHTFWSLASFILSRDTATSPSTKSRTRVFIGGYDYGYNPKTRLGLYLSALHGRSTSNYLAKTLAKPQPIQSRALSHTYAIHPYVSYSFSDWLSTYVAVGQSWGRTRTIKTRSNPLYGNAGIPSRQNESTFFYSNTSSQDASFYLSAVKSMQKVTLQGQMGMILTWNSINGYTVYEPYTPPTTVNLVPESTTRTRQATALVRTIYNDWENFLPYVDLGATCDLKQQFVTDALSGNNIYRSRLSYQAGLGMRFFPKSKIQGGLSFFYIGGKRQVESRGLNIDIRYIF